MASFHKFLCIFFPFFFTILCFSNAYTFTIGGKDGWTLHPSQDYNQFSNKSRFIVNDILHFKYNGASDSVLVVSKGDYDSCNINSPITTLTGGDSYFTLNRPGPFYFISGNKSNCDQGQKLTVVVISPKTKKAPPAGAPAPAKSTGSPISSPPGSETPGSNSPASSPGGGGMTSSPTGSPAGSPGGMGSSSPTGGPAAAPGISASPTGNPAGVNGPAPGGGISASPTGNPADSNGPAPTGSPAGAGIPAVCASLTVPIVMIIFMVGWVY